MPRRKSSPRGAARASARDKSPDPAFVGGRALERARQFADARGLPEPRPGAAKSGSKKPRRPKSG
jgi:hypothetical protein